MAELLIKAIDASHADPTKDARGCYKAGDVVVVMDDGWTWGVEEVRPRSQGGKFAIVQISGVTAAQVRQYIQMWRRTVSFSVVSSNLPQDRWRLQVSADAGTFNAITNEAKVTQADVENYLGGWNATLIAVADNAVTFEATIFNAATSPSFWSLSPVTIASMSFTEQSYVQATGTHTIALNYAASGFTDQQVATYIRTKGGTVISGGGGSGVFSITRTVVRNAFQNDLQGRIERVFRRRRYQLSASQLAVLSETPPWTSVTLAQLQSALTDKTAV